MLPILDIIHRGVVYSLVGLTIYAGVGIVSTHNNTMRAGRDTDGPVSEALARHEEEMRKQQTDAQSTHSGALAINVTSGKCGVASFQESTAVSIVTRKTYGSRTKGTCFTAA
ncbi:hypothetical protein IW262DRAFT_1294781 [Armillaria fumosa]|nr:hypothetical protein IW262DRAFT_1294781 [Armillaria fumosa]